MNLGVVYYCPFFWCKKYIIKSWINALERLICNINKCARKKLNIWYYGLNVFASSQNSYIEALNPNVMGPLESN